MKLGIAGGVVLVLLWPRSCSATRRCSPSTRRSRRWWCGSASRSAWSPSPGLHFKAPLIDSVIAIDKRILDLENPAQEVIASDQKRLVVDAFARYRIQDPLRFYQTVNTIQGANSQLSILLNAALRRVLGEATLTHVVRDERAQLMARVREQLDKEAQVYGISVVDVRIRRADLPDQNSQAVYQRMQTERQREAAEFRAQGSQQGAGDPLQGRPRRDRAGRRGDLQVRAGPRRGRRRTKPDLRRGVRQGSRTSSRSTARCRPTRRA